MTPFGVFSKSDVNWTLAIVCKSKNPSLVGCGGIVILETENTFKVITEKNELKGLGSLLYKIASHYYGQYYPKKTPHLF